MAFRTSVAQEPAVLQAFLSHLALGFSVGAVLIAVLAVVLAALARIGGRRNFDEHLD
jgi:tetrahydromethanopterin S-methyltransferase subunit B